MSRMSQNPCLTCPVAFEIRATNSGPTNDELLSVTLYNPNHLLHRYSTLASISSSDSNSIESETHVADWETGINDAKTLLAYAWNAP